MREFTDIFSNVEWGDVLKQYVTSTRVSKINLYKKTGSVDIHASCDVYIPFALISTIESKLTSVFDCSNVNLKVKYPVIDDLKEILKNFKSDILEILRKKMPICIGILDGASFKAQAEDCLSISLSCAGKELLRAKGCDRAVERIVLEMFGKKIRVFFEDGEGVCKNVSLASETNELVGGGSQALKATDSSSKEEVGEIYGHDIDIPFATSSYLERVDVRYGDEKNVGEGVKKVAEENKASITDVASKGKENTYKRKNTGSKHENKAILLGKAFSDPISKINTVSLESGTVAIKGEVFRVETRPLRDGKKMLVTFDITDYTNSVTVKFFIKIEKFDEIKEELIEGSNLIVRGDSQYDKFSRELSIMAKDILLANRQAERQDDAPKKRVELHLHTQMSGMDGMSSVKDLIKRASFWGHSAVAITDHGVVQAFPDAMDAARKYGIKVIYGVECYLVDDVELCANKRACDINEFKNLKPYHAIILVEDYEGLKNLYKIISLSHLDYFYKKPRVPKCLLIENRKGLIVGSACEAGEIYKAFLEKKDDTTIQKIASLYDYLEIQPIGNNKFLIQKELVKDEAELKNINKKIVELGKMMGKPVVATCDVHFLEPRDEVFRRVLMAGQGFKDADNQAPLYFRTTNEMLAEFDYLGDDAYDVVVENTNKIADRVQGILPIPDGTFPPMIDGSEEELTNITMKKAKEIYGEVLPGVVQKRLEKELNSIISNGFAVLYIISQKLVWKSLEDGYLVGSRGSVGSSFVANMAGITEVNSLPPHYICENCKYSEFIEDGSFGCGFDLPEKNCPKCGKILKKDGYDIPFETFLGFEGDKEPDIDLNFSGEYQPVAHQYTEDLFGKGQVYRAGTIGTIADKTAFGFVKGYVDDKNMQVTNAEITRLVRGCAGVKRTTGQHPGGVMIVPQDKHIYEFCPIQRPANDNNSTIITTHFDYHSISGRLLKLDILGHDDPTMIRMLEDLTNVDATTIPIGEKKTMGIFRGTEPLGVSPEDINSPVGTFAVPEFGTKFVRQMLVDTRPTTFAELIRISGLSHGTDVWLNNAQDLVREGVASLPEVICTRDDIMLYLMYGGVPPKTSFKIMEDVRKGKGLKEEYLDIMNENNIPKWYIDSCNKIKYMFPKAHAAAYVMMAFRIAWFKVYYPEAFYVSYYTVRATEFDAMLMAMGKEKLMKHIAQYEAMGNEMTQKEKNLLTIMEVVNEMYARGINFLPVDLYHSDATKFILTKEGIRLPFNSLQGLGDNAAKNIVQARKNGKFLSVEDVSRRAKVSKTVIEILEVSGALEGMTKTNQLSFC